MRRECERRKAERWIEERRQVEEGEGGEGRKWRGSAGGGTLIVCPMTLLDQWKVRESSLTFHTLTQCGAHFIFTLPMLPHFPNPPKPSKLSHFHTLHTLCRICIMHPTPPVLCVFCPCLRSECENHTRPRSALDMPRTSSALCAALCVCFPCLQSECEKPSHAAISALGCRGERAQDWKQITKHDVVLTTYGTLQSEHKVSTAHFCCEYTTLLLSTVHCTLGLGGACAVVQDLRVRTCCACRACPFAGLCRGSGRRALCTRPTGSGWCWTRPIAHQTGHQQWRLSFALNSDTRWCPSQEHPSR